MFRRSLRPQQENFPPAPSTLIACRARTQTGSLRERKPPTSCTPHLNTDRRVNDTLVRLFNSCSLLYGTVIQMFSSKELKPTGKTRKGPNTRERLLRACSADKTKRSDTECTHGTGLQDTVWIRPGRTNACGPDCQRMATPQRIQSRESEASKRVAGLPSSTADQQGRPSRGHPEGSVRGGSSLQARTR